MISVIAGFIHPNLSVCCVWHALPCCPCFSVHVPIASPVLLCILFGAYNHSEHTKLVHTSISLYSISHVYIHASVTFTLFLSYVFTLCLCYMRAI